MSTFFSFLLKCLIQLGRKIQCTWMLSQDVEHIFIIALNRTWISNSNLSEYNGITRCSTLMVWVENPSTVRTLCFLSINLVVPINLIVPICQYSAREDVCQWIPRHCLGFFVPVAWILCARGRSCDFIGFTRWNLLVGFYSMVHKIPSWWWL